jgi:ectoine hydroxylase-related dioxygenase (phytanoyl-CoA dioxygenase family)
LIKSNNCGFLNRGFGFRFDYPAREKYLTQLHQDYHANLGSPNGLVFYTPITSINNKKQGPVVVYQGSHKEGIRKVFISKSYNKSTSYIINLKKDELSLYNKINLYLDQGDLAIFDFRLLHESSKNLSSKVRISFIHRYFDFNNLVAKRNKFIGGLQEGNFFEDFHPDLVV